MIILAMGFVGLVLAFMGSVAWWIFCHFDGLTCFVLLCIYFCICLGILMSMLED